MQKSDVIFGLLVPPNENAAEAVHPTMSTLYNPAPSSFLGVLFERLSFFASRPDVGREAEFLQRVAHFVVVIALVQAHMLLLLFGRLRAIYHDALNRRPHQLHVVAIGAIGRQTNRHTVPFGQQAALDARFGTISRVGTAFFPRPTGLWSSPRPYLPIPNQSRAVHRSARPLPATTSRTHQLSPTLETGRAPLTLGKGLSGLALSIGTLCAERKRWHQRNPGPVSVGDHHQSDGYSHAPAAAVVAPPTAHPIRGSRSSSCCLAFGYVFVSAFAHSCI